MTGIGLEDLIIRPAARGDVSAIVALLANDALGSGREIAETADTALPDSYYRAFEAIDTDPNSHLIVAERAGRVVGCFQLTFLTHISFRGGVRAQIESVRVADELRGQGIGGHMMEWAIDQARGRGCSMVQLTSNRTRPDAHRFYQRLGLDDSHVGMKLKL